MAEIRWRVCLVVSPEKAKRRWKKQSAKTLNFFVGCLA
jgi:hypothetical protein